MAGPFSVSGKTMHILYIDISDLADHIPDALCKRGHIVDRFNPGSLNPGYDQVLLKRKLVNVLDAKENPYDFVFSFDFFSVVSDVCYERDCIYISWIYVSPQTELFHPSASHPNNRIFVFDKSFFDRLSVFKIPGLFYLPLAGNVTQLSRIPFHVDDEEKYTCEVSFVGSMYENNTYNHSAHLLSEEIKKEIDTYLLENYGRWEGIREWPKLSDEAVGFYKNLSIDKGSLANRMKLAEYYGCIVESCKLCEMERTAVMKRLCGLFDLKIYTNSNSAYLSDMSASVMPPVDYRTDMLKVFHYSKINLNISLPSIEQGVPLRVFDIMSAGGFCLTNYQAGIEELFQIGEEIEVFHNEKELYAKIAYYLKHKEERQRIAVNGFCAIRNRHSYDIRLKELLKLSGVLSKGQTGDDIS